MEQEEIQSKPALQSVKPVSGAEYEDSLSITNNKESIAPEHFVTHALSTRLNTSYGPMTVLAQVSGILVTALIDTGASCSILNKRIQSQITDIKLIQKSTNKVLTANLKPLNITGSCTIPITIGKTTKDLTLLISDDISYDLLLGNDALDKFQVTICYQNNSIKCKKNNPIPISTMTTNIYRAHSLHTVEVPAFSVALVQTIVNCPLHIPKHGILQASRKLSKIHLDIPKSLVIEVP